MIRTFSHKGLAELWERGKSAEIDSRKRKRILKRLDALDAASRPEDMDIPGFDFHQLKGKDAGRYTVHVNGPWCVTFAWEDGDAVKVNFEQYH